jgi:hypothetical protein
MFRRRITSLASALCSSMLLNPKASCHLQKKEEYLLEVREPRRVWQKLRVSITLAAVSIDSTLSNEGFGMHRENSRLQKGFVDVPAVRLAPPYLHPVMLVLPSLG